MFILLYPLKFLHNYGNNAKHLAYIIPLTYLKKENEDDTKINKCKMYILSLYPILNIGETSSIKGKKKV